MFKAVKQSSIHIMNQSSENFTMDTPTTSAFTPTSTRPHSRRCSISSQISDLTLTPRIESSDPIQRAPPAEYREFHTITFTYHLKKDGETLELKKEKVKIKKDEVFTPYEKIVETLEILAKNGQLREIESMIDQEEKDTGRDVMLSFLETANPISHCGRKRFGTVFLEILPAEGSYFQLHVFSNTIGYQPLCSFDEYRAFNVDGRRTNGSGIQDYSTVRAKVLSMRLCQNVQLKSYMDFRSEQLGQPVALQTLRDCSLVFGRNSKQAVYEIHIISPHLHLPASDVGQYLEASPGAFPPGKDVFSISVIAHQDRRPRGSFEILKTLDRLDPAPKTVLMDLKSKKERIKGSELIFTDLEVVSSLFTFWDGPANRKRSGETPLEVVFVEFDEV
ncbi:hypothetical protein BJ508DRAFT_360213 [Ascobolus immersus RN42]|uniref:Uncharacterized protein n=1 Tax=Ascobolus immersus RN42 TaxID=1160509 RepID=A0A3N4ICP4_ASCIM|nr:hypothetical protein BJ508DRAFT_360213 [Ascobolus immersus RN42]